MNFAERAFRYLFRKKGKAIILFWVLLITETMILSTVTILRASEVARIELLGKSKAKLLIEREKAEELFTDDEYKKLEKLENVKAVNRVAEVQLYPMDFKIITKSESVDADNQKLRIMAYDKYYRDVVILCNFPNYCRDFSFIFSERNADLKVRTAGTGKYWYLYRWIYCTGFKNTRCGGSYNERNGSDGYWDDIRYFDYCSISSRNHDNEEKAEADIK